MSEMKGIDQFWDRQRLALVLSLQTWARGRWQGRTVSLSPAGPGRLVALEAFAPWSWDGQMSLKLSREMRVSHGCRCTIVNVSCCCGHIQRHTMGGWSRESISFPPPFCSHFPLPSRPPTHLDYTVAKAQARS